MIMAVEGVSLVLSASGAWMWASGKQLKIKVGKGSDLIFVDKMGVLFWEHVKQAVMQGVAGKAYHHVPAATAAGSIGKINIRAKKSSFATACFCDENPLVMLKARGKFDVMAVKPSIIPSAQPLHDMILKHSGTWSIEEENLESSIIVQVPTNYFHFPDFKASDDWETEMWHVLLQLGALLHAGVKAYVGITSGNDPEEAMKGRHYAHKKKMGITHMACYFKSTSQDACRKMEEQITIEAFAHAKEAVAQTDSKQDDNSKKDDISQPVSSETPEEKMMWGRAKDLGNLLNRNVGGGGRESKGPTYYLYLAWKE